MKKHMEGKKHATFVLALQLENELKEKMLNIKN
jgi:hypothetical protein